MIERGDGWELRLGDWRDVMSDVSCDALITDPPGQPSIFDLLSVP